MRTIPKWRWLFIWLILCQSSACQSPEMMGGDESMYLAPGDRLQLDNGQMGLVDAEGMLRGLTEEPIAVSGRRAREVAEEVSRSISFQKYAVTAIAPRVIEVRGAVRRPGCFPMPLHESWHIMDLLLAVNGLLPDSQPDFLLVRKVPQQFNPLLFIHGEALAIEQGLGGDDLQLMAGDVVLFPGPDHLIYVFGAVKAPVAFTFAFDRVPTLAEAISQSGGLVSIADADNCQVYRLLHPTAQSIYTLSYPLEKEFSLAPWDIIYIPTKILP